MIGRPLDRTREQSRDVLLDLAVALSADTLVAENALRAEQVRICAFQSGRHPFIMDRQNELMAGRRINDILHELFILLRCDIDKAGLHTLDAPLLKIIEQLVRRKAVAATRIREEFSVDVEDDPDVFAVCIRTNGWNVHIRLETAGCPELCVYVKTLAAGIEYTFTGVLPAAFSIEILCAEDLIARIVRVQFCGIEARITVGIIFRPIPARVQQNIADPLARRLIYDALDRGRVHALRAQARA